jgi:hypothetical protein
VIRGADLRPAKTALMMATNLYCWRCKADIPMLDEAEWQQILPSLMRGLIQIKEYRQRHGASLTEAKEKVYGAGALEKYFEITGYRETNINALWHHRLCMFGPPCSLCGKPLRTPRAKFCAACGALH